MTYGHIYSHIYDIWSAPEKGTFRVYLPKHGHVWYLFYRNRCDKSFSELCTNLQPKLQSVVCQCKALSTDLLCVACDHIVVKNGTMNENEILC